jgi:prepilin-type N-terminal cleavage/methylation domain-containing protein
MLAIDNRAALRPRMLSPRRIHSRQAGFTIAELMMVVLIAGIITAVSIPYITTTVSNMYLGSAASSLSGEFASARYQAISSGCPVQVTVNSQSYQVAAQCIIGSTSPSCPASGTAQTCSSSFYNYCGGGYTTSACLTPFAASQISVSTTSPTNVIYFNSNGVVSTTTAALGGVPTTFTVTLQQLIGGTTKTVKVSGVGYVKTTTP